MFRMVSVSKTSELGVGHVKTLAAIPCFNTQKTIGEVVVRTKKYVDDVVVINDGSFDKTAELATKAGARVINHSSNKGYGEAIKSCLQAAREGASDILIILDGDGQHNPDEIPSLLTPLFRKEADLVIGSRFLTNRCSVPYYRRFGIKLITFLWNIGSRIKVSDTQSGFRAYSKPLINAIQISEKGMGASIEILENTRGNQFNIKEIPISCSYGNNNSYFTPKAFLHGISVAIFVVKIRLRSSLVK